MNFDLFKLLAFLSSTGTLSSSSCDLFFPWAAIIADTERESLSLLDGPAQEAEYQLQEMQRIAVSFFSAGAGTEV